MHEEKIIELCKKYLSSVGINQEEINRYLDSVIEILVNRLPKVCILKENRNFEGGNQTHIHITGESMKFFYNDKQLLNPVIELGNDTKLEIFIFRANLISLKNRAWEKYGIDNKIEISSNEVLIPSYTYKKIGRIANPPIQVQLSKIKLDDEYFMFMRHCLFQKDYLVFLKRLDGSILLLGIPYEFFFNKNYNERSSYIEIELPSSKEYEKDINFREVDNFSIASYKPKDEEDLEENIVDLSKGIFEIKKRTERHQDIVKLLANNLAGAGYKLYEYPVDCLALKNNELLLFEIKTLNGRLSDEKKQVRNAFSQLFYYEEFYVKKKFELKVKKYVLFEKKISDDHIEFFEKYGINVLWINDNNIIGKL